jgi:hypothetical protein
MMTAGCALVIGFLPRASYAADYSPLNAPATITSADQNTSGNNVVGSFIENWLAMVTATRSRWCLAP